MAARSAGREAFEGSEKQDHQNQASRDVKSTPHLAQGSTRGSTRYSRGVWAHPIMVVYVLSQPQPQQETFEEHLAKLKQAGFEVEREAPGRARVLRGGNGAIVEDAGGGKVKLGKAGVLVAGEIALLISGGYQMFLRTPSGKEVPALAPQLKVAARL